MARTIAWLRVGRLALLGAGLALGALAACSSQQEEALSALHYFQRGNAAYQAEDYRRAIEHYRMAIKFDDEAPDLYYNLGLAYYRAGAYEDAVKAYQRAVKLDPAFADAHLNLALAYDRIYNAAAANLHYNRYRSLVTGSKEPASVASSGGSAPAATGGGVATHTTASAAGGVGTGAAATAGAGHTARTSLTVPQSARPGSVPPADSLQSTREAPPNPFQGNRKWWTQDAAGLNR